MYKNLYNKIANGQGKIAVVGLGYVGLPIAIAFDKKAKVIGFDISKSKINSLVDGRDLTKEMRDEVIKKTNIEFTCDEIKLQEAKFIIVAVPTPINEKNKPDLSHVESASQIVGRNLSKGSIVVYESTVYPGVTEEICKSILEKESCMECGVDFKLGYSPERINPGDSIHKLESIVKVVSGMDDETADIVAKVYEMVIEAGVFKASSIKVAEAAKVVENSQRDINIAFMNELSIILNGMDIDTSEVLKAASTKWNFLNFSPGLVGGHCISVDPYYLIYKAEQNGYKSSIIATGRSVNESMATYVINKFYELMKKANKKVEESRVAILGITYKKDCLDIRNSKVINIINKLSDKGVDCVVSDYVADADSVRKMYQINLVEFNKINNVDAVILAVPHSKYRNLMEKQISTLYRNTKKRIIIDIEGVCNRNVYKNNDYLFWRL